MLSTLILVSIICVVAVTFLHCKRKNVPRLPKGPAGVPLLGNILQMFFTYPHLKLTQWIEQHGDLYTIYLGTRPALVVSDAKLLKQLLSQYAATGKFKTEIFLVISRGLYGINMTDGQLHTEQRSVGLKILKSFGFGSKAVESKILPEIPITCDLIESQIEKGGGSVVLYGLLKQAISNTLWTFVTGEQLEGEDSHKIVNLMDRFIETFQYSGKTGLCFLPWLRHVAPKLSGYTALEEVCEDLHRVIKDAFDREKASWRKDSDPRHVMDCYIDYLSKCDDPENSFYGEDGVKNSLAALSEMFIGAAEATAATLMWLVFYVSWAPDVQRKLQQEIDGIVGENGSPSLEDKPRMPYTEAVILEGQRYSSMIPLGLIHEMLEDIPDFHGYRLPKGLLIVPNVYGIHHSKKTWGDPENLRPERFLSGSGSKVESMSSQNLRDYMVQFLPGRRSCLGEPLAKDFMFLMVTHFFQRFHVTPEPEIAKEKYLDADVGFGIIPKHLSLQIRKRR